MIALSAGAAAATALTVWWNWGEDLGEAFAHRCFRDVPWTLSWTFAALGGFVAAMAAVAAACAVRGGKLAWNSGGTDTVLMVAGIVAWMASTEGVTDDVVSFSETALGAASTALLLLTCFGAKSLRRVYGFVGLLSWNLTARSVLRRHMLAARLAFRPGDVVWSGEGTVAKEQNGAYYATDVVSGTPSKRGVVERVFVDRGVPYAVAADGPTGERWVFVVPVLA